MNAGFPILTVLVVVPLIAGILLAAVKPLRSSAKVVGLVVAVVELALAIYAVTMFDVGHAASVQLTEQAPWIPAIGVSWALGVNGLGLAMILLATFLVPVVIIAREPGEGGPDWQWISLVLVLEAIMVAVFAARDVFLFYILFEVMLLPVYFLVGRFGGPDRKRAALKFLLFQLGGGLILLLLHQHAHHAGTGILGEDGRQVAPLSARHPHLCLGVFGRGCGRRPHPDGKQRHQNHRDMDKTERHAGVGHKGVHQPHQHQARGRYGGEDGVDGGVAYQQRHDKQ